MLIVSCETSLQFFPQIHLYVCIVSGTVQSLVAIALSSRSMNISWQPPVDRQTAEQIDHYQINITHVGGFEYLTTTLATSMVVGSLHPNYVYQCSVSYITNGFLGPVTHVKLQLPPEGLLITYSRIQSTCNVCVSLLSSN